MQAFHNSLLFLGMHLILICTAGAIGQGNGIHLKRGTANIEEPDDSIVCPIVLKFQHHVLSIH